MKKTMVLLLSLVMLFSTTKAMPVISFFNEQKTPDLIALFRDSTLIPTLQKLHAEIRMGMVDLTPERAAIVQQLNQSGIPVVAWLLLPEADGYSLNSSNGNLAIERYLAIKKWAEEHHLVFKGIGIEQAFDHNDARLIRENTRKWIRKIPGRLYNKAAMEEGRAQYAKLISMIKTDGYFSECYYLPFLKDEAAANRTSLQLATRLFELKTDREIPLLYSSYIGLGDGMIQVYGFDAHAKYVALGSTAVSSDTAYIKSGILEYEELLHDINIAAKQVEEVHINNLEGCVQNGYLNKLLDYRYDSTLVVNQEEVTDIKKIQENFNTISNILSYPTLILLFIAIILGLITWFLVYLVRKLIAFIS